MSSELQGSPRVWECLAEYLLYFFGIFFFAWFIDIIGLFDRVTSYFAQRSYRNLSEAIHRSRCKRDYAKQLAKDRYERLPFFSKFAKCFKEGSLKDSEIDMEEVEREYAEWKKERKLHPEEIAHQQGCSCTIRKKEKLSEYYFTELLNVSYLGTCAYRRNAASEKFSVCGLFNVHFSRGFLSDFIYYMMNNHSFLSMFMAVRGHPFSRAARRLTYLSANSVTFFMAVLLTKLDPVAAQVVSVLAISPLVILVRKWMFSLLACPCHREVLEREDRNCAYWWYACLGGTGQLLAYFFVCAFVAILLPAAVLTVKTENDHAPQLIIAYAHSVTLASFGQEFIYALLVFWTGEACVTIKLCGSPVLGYGGYFRDKVHILGLRGLRLQMLQLTVMQEQLERRLEREAEERRRLELLENGYASSAVDAAAATGGVAADDAEDDQLPPAEFRRSVSVQDIPPSILHQYDYAIQEMEWLRYLTCGAIQVEFYVSIPFIREFVREFKDEYADMDDDRSAQYSQETTVGVELEDAALPDKLVSTVVDKWNRLFTTSTTDSRPVSTASVTSTSSKLSSLRQSSTTTTTTAEASKPTSTRSFAAEQQSVPPEASATTPATAMTMATTTTTIESPIHATTTDATK